MNLTEKGQELKLKLEVYRTLYCGRYTLTIAYGNMSILQYEGKAIASLATALRIALEIEEPEKWVSKDRLIENMPISLDEEELEIRDIADNIGFPDFKNMERYYDTVDYSTVSNDYLDR